MADIILINPAFEKLFTIRKLKANIPLGAIFLGSYVEQESDYTVKVMDGNNYTQEEMFKRIDKEINKAKILGISAMTDHVPNGIEIAKHIRSRDSDIPIVWGGVHPTLYPKQIVESKLADYAVYGEGEIPLLKLMKVLEGKEKPENVESLAFKRNGQVIMNEKLKQFLDLNKLKSINWGLLDIVEEQGLREIGKDIEFPMVSSRGCTYKKCTFCINTVLENFYRSRDINMVLDDVEFLVENGVKDIFYMDEVFFSFPQRVKNFITGIKERKLEFEWYGDIRADYVIHLGIDMLKEASKYGCTKVGIGAEFGSQKMLDKIKKGITVEQLLKSADMLNEADIIPIWSFMIGIPGETLEDMMQTVWIFEHLKRKMPKSRFLGPQLYRPYPGSELYFECLKFGWREPQSLEEWGVEALRLNETNATYPWLEVPIEKINEIVFYLMIGYAYMPRGLKYMHYNLAHKIIRWRCKNKLFLFPIEKKIFDLIVNRKLPR